MLYFLLFPRVRISGPHDRVVEITVPPDDCAYLSEITGPCTSGLVSAAFYSVALYIRFHAHTATFTGDNIDNIRFTILKLSVQRNSDHPFPLVPVTASEEPTVLLYTVTHSLALCPGAASLSSL